MTSLVADDEGLASLEEKYRRIAALRAERAKDPRAVASAGVLAALAARFPGALRELDDLPDADIAARREALVRARRGEAPVLPWMTAQVLFHMNARGALAVKRWLRGRRDIGDAERADFADAVARGELDAEAQAFAGELERLARPPSGRLLNLVYARVAAALATTPEEVRALVRSGGLRG